ADRRDRYRGRQSRDELRERLTCRLRGRVAPVGPDVNASRYAGRGENAHKADGVVLVRMDAARRDEPHEVTAAFALEAGNELLQCGLLLDLVIFDCLADARQILHDDAARAAIELAYLGLTHWPGGQADILAGGAQQGVRAASPQPVEMGRARLPHRVVGGVVPPAPAVEDRKHHRAPLLHYRFLHVNSPDWRRC